jgi:hypothetical protein
LAHPHGATVVVGHQTVERREAVVRAVAMAVGWRASPTYARTDVLDATLPTFVTRTSIVTKGTVE